MNDGVFYYFGDDKVFFSGLKGHFDTSSNKIEIKKFFATQERLIQSLFVEVAEGQPDAVLIDFSLHPEDYLHLARILTRTPFEKDIKIIGVFDHLKIDQILVEAQSTGISLSFIKSDHIKDICNTLERLVYPKKVMAPNYVKTKLTESWIAGLVSKVGYITEKGIHFETNLKMKVGEKINVQHFWRNKTLIPSKQVVVKKVTKDNLVYNFISAVDAEFEFVDRPFEDQTPDEEVKRLQLIDDVKYRFKRIFLQNHTSSSAKISKVLILDSKFTIYQGKRSDRYPYMIRSLGSEINLIEELDKFIPQIIVISLDEIILKETVSVIKNWCSKKDLSPFLVVFNSKESITQWQENLNYKNILASGEGIDIDILLKMATAYENKHRVISKDEEKKIFISKNKEESNCQVELNIEVVRLSESDIVFTSSKKIPLESNLFIMTPIKSLIYVLSEVEQNGIFQYEGMLHSIGALEKNFIRRYINAALFKENNPEAEEPEVDFKLEELLKKGHFKTE